MRHGYAFRFLVAFLCSFWAGFARSQAQTTEGLVPDSTELRVLRQFVFATTPSATWQTVKDLPLKQWPGIRLENGDVVSIYFGYSNLQGPLHPCLGELRQLQSLTLTQNQLTGPIPGTYRNWTKLRELSIDQNRFTGGLPEWIGELSQLEWLNLNHNLLTGLLPASLGRIPLLRGLFLADNQFSGALPPSVSQLVHLQQLHLWGNQLTGGIPMEWRGLHALTELRLDRNQLSGPLPVELTQLVNLEVLYLQNNKFSGWLPTTFGQLEHLRLLDLANNRFSGPLPASYTHLSHLSYADLSHNTFIGSLPADFGALQKLSHTNLSDNGFSGPLPTSLGQMTALNYFYADRNQFSGPLPAELGNASNLVHLTLSGNRLNGSLPAGVLRLPRVSLLTLHDNLFTGTEDAGPGPFPASLNVARNQLDFAALEALYKEPNYPKHAALEMRWQLPKTGLPETKAGVKGQIMTLEATIPGQHNRYQWERKLGAAWVALVGATQAQYTLTLQEQGQEGEYRARVINDWVPEMTLYSRSIHLSMLPYAPLALNEPVTTGCPSPATVMPPTDRTGTRDSVNYVRTYIPRVPLTTLTSSSGTAGSSPAPAAITTPTGSGTLWWEMWEASSQAPTANRAQLAPPTRRQTVSAAEGLSNIADNYTARLRGYVQAPQTGMYTFWVAGDDDCQLWLSPDADSTHRVHVAGVPGWTQQREWYKYPEQQSASVMLVAGQYYYIEAQQHEHGGGDNLAVAWRLPDGTFAGPITGYLSTYVPVTAEESSPAGSATLLADNWTKEQVQIKTEYLDGLGRQVQTVLRQESPTGRDIVQPVAYDALGRQAKQYLPYTAIATAEGAYQPNALRQQYDFYQGSDPALASLVHTLPKTGVPFSETVFEASPLNRPLLQASPGESWMLSRGNVVMQQERPNTLADSVQRWQPGYDTNREDLVLQPAYASGELWMKQTRDEQGHWVQEFSDKEGHVVLKQVGLDGTYAQPATQWLKTYYVYDDFGRLRAVLPPKAVQRLRKLSSLGPWQVTGAGVEHLLFRYHYDEQGRLIEKKIPDQDGYSYTVYNELDQPILSQDVAQQATKEWVATKYDALGRVVYTALVRFPTLSGTSAQQRAELQRQATASTAALWEAPSSTTTLTQAYYSHTSFPDVTQLTGSQLLTVSYYDSYDFDQNGQAEASYQAPTATQLACAPSEVPPVDLRVTGQTTRSLVRVLGVAESAPGAWLTTTSFFDEKLRPIQVQSTNARGGTDVVSTRYDFTGKALASYAVHQVPGQAAHTVREQSRYDHAGRLLTVTQELDQATPQVLARHTYNELGQLEQKQLGGNLAASTGAAVTPPPPTAGPKALQTVDYRYNIRGWLTSINDVQNPNAEDLWNFSLHYDCGFDEKQYNGNIAGQTWRSLSDGIERAYGYRYDNVNRLLQGDFVARTSTSPTSSWGAERGNYRFAFASYDAGGNLLTLRRRGLVAAATRTTAAQYAETDNLRYRYQPTTNSEPVSNRLQRVDDLAPAATAFGGKLPERPDFSDGSTSGSQSPDYTYDAAGSLLSDRNKGITHIQYNYLHLPELIEWSNGNKLQYVYTATGQKVGKLATPAAVAGKPTLAPVRTDYLGAWQYEKDSLRWLNHAEGRALMIYRRNAAQGIDSKVQYEYTLKDHLGNLRVAFHPGERTTYMAMLDSDPDQTRREQHQFDSVSVSAPIRQVVGGQFAHGGDGVALLNASGAQPRPLGPLKQLAVAKSDTVLVTAFGMYQQKVNTNTTWGFSLAGFVASLLQQPQPTATPSAEGTRRVRVLPLLNAGLTAATLPALQQLAGGVPKAYLRVLVFNSDSVLVRVKTKQLSLASEGGYEQLQDSVVVPRSGYVQAYVANESDTDVFFDDITVEHRQGLQVQENQYDPYGLDLAGLSKAATPQNQYTWNGKEKQTEFGLNWHDHGWRFYDPTLGRWVVSDPDAEKGGQESWGSYQFGLDNAVRYNDLDGRQAGIGDMLKTVWKTVASTVVNIAAKAKGVSYDEALFGIRHPNEALVIGTLDGEGYAGVAARMADNLGFNDTGGGSIPNAIRHTLASALTARSLGQAITLEANEAHGDTDPNSPILDSKIDYYNNTVGRSIGVDPNLAEYSPKEMAMYVLDLAQEGWLKMNNKQKTEPTHTSMTRKEYRNAKAAIMSMDNSGRTKKQASDKAIEDRVQQEGNAHGARIL
ncbi:hypothetical protein K3G63_21930 [Hymenobacter sp. HSC-4F20]|uniref:DUF6443 domain-containing protein n=1 Tax=Hymenobacter sp. HSC-4F20 TaxID=2864135 RepID=UPI001C72D2B1|nr:DUF6443 domain-containing protein [Hymenobacter sp. HSC-4F20]MBX0293120.1 hypothetical protein [Hymenobacter sp. HSC-4F20]